MISNKSSDFVYLFSLSKEIVLKANQYHSNCKKYETVFRKTSNATWIYHVYATKDILVFDFMYIYKSRYSKKK